VTGKGQATTEALGGLTGALADIVCWMAFYLHQCEDDEVDLEVADELAQVLAEALRGLPVSERLRFLEHASSRASSSTVEDYQHFLRGLAETLGLE
jgi:hypothetical protein